MSAWGLRHCTQQIQKIRHLPFLLDPPFANPSILFKISNPAFFCHFSETPFSLNRGSGRRGCSYHVKRGLRSPFSEYVPQVTQDSKAPLWILKYKELRSPKVDLTGRQWYNGWGTHMWDALNIGKQKAKLC